MIVDARPGERRAIALSFVYFFCVMVAWFVLRPIRDAVAAQSGANNLPWLFAGTLTVTLLFNPLFSALVVRYPVRRVIAIAYHVFAANLLAFHFFMRFSGIAEGSPADVWMGVVFYVWTSMFNMFVISIFWSFMADMFTSDQAKRLFGFIGVGGTLGSIAGSFFAAHLTARLGVVNLFLISAVTLELAVLIVWRFPSRARVAAAGRAATLAEAPLAEPPPAETPIGGSAWAGFTRVVRSPYLAGISAFLALYILGSTVLYAQQSDLVRGLYATRETQTTVLATLEFWAQTLTVVTQIFLTGRIIRWFGLAATLAIVPALSMLGFSWLGVVPVFGALAVFTVCRRAGNFALMNPAMETLFTVVSREDKYKAKSFIETFVYRFSDQITIWIYAGLTWMGLGLSGIALTVVPLAGVSLVLAIWLGQQQARQHVGVVSPMSR